MKTITFSAKDVQLILGDIELDEMAAEASISKNPNVTWMKLILADDQYNANRQKIPREEFANVIKTGIFMPIKMANGRINEGHEDALPMGVMSHLKVNGNTIEALAALWKRERPTDIEFLKKRFEKGEPIDFSWELTYTESDEEEAGQVLKGISMNAATIVGMPAYQGRTNTVALSSDEHNTTGDNTDMDTITKEAHDAALNALKGEYDTKLAEAQTATVTVQEKLTELEKEVVTLREFKATVDAEKAKAEKLGKIRQKFADAELTVADSYFTEKADVLLALDDAGLDFFIQELVSALSSRKEKEDETVASISITSKVVPALNRSSDDPDKDSILEYLNKQYK